MRKSAVLLIVLLVAVIGFAVHLETEIADMRTQIVGVQPPTSPVAPVLSAEDTFWWNAAAPLAKPRPEATKTKEAYGIPVALTLRGEFGEGYSIVTGLKSGSYCMSTWVLYAGSQHGDLTRLTTMDNPDHIEHYVDGKWVIDRDPQNVQQAVESFRRVLNKVLCSRT